MNVRRRSHSRREDRLHILCGALLSCSDDERTDFGQPHTVARSPAFSLDGQEPNFSQGFNDGARGPFVPFAAARVGYASRCQKAENCLTCPIGLSAMIQHPISWVRWLTGLQTAPGTP